MIVIPGERCECSAREGDPGVKHRCGFEYLGSGSRSLRSLAGMTGYIA
jgi:hypothetical protein